MTSLTRSAAPNSIHAVLGSIVAATLAGCSGGETSRGPSTGAGEERVAIATTNSGEDHVSLATTDSREDHLSLAAIDSREERVALAATDRQETSEAGALVAREHGRLVCLDAVPSRVQGLAPAFTYDSFAYYTGRSGHPRIAPEFELVELEGDPCASAADAAACRAEVENVRAGAATWWHYDNFFVSTWSLLLATGVEGPDRSALERGLIVPRGFGYDETLTHVPPAAAADAGAADAGAADAGAADAGGHAALDASPVTTIDDIDELLAFLGTIDTPNEAALVMYANNRPLTSCAMDRDGEDFVARGTWQISDCPITTQSLELRVTPDGVFSELEVGSANVSAVCVGRRPDGLCASEARPEDETPGEWLARTARLEAAAVAAFVFLARELEALAAPPALLARLKQAARDEIAHAERITELARARGVEPPPAVVIPPAGRSLLEIAIENTVEGCVRECWGALCARFQAAAAQAPDVRAAFTHIAREEAEHAQLSRDVAAWLEPRLQPAERARVDAARARAISDLRRELACELPERWSAELGLPTCEQALVAFAALERTGLLAA